MELFFSDFPGFPWFPELVVILFKETCCQTTGRRTDDEHPIFTKSSLSVYGSSELKKILKMLLWIALAEMKKKITLNSILEIILSIFKKKLAVISNPFIGVYRLNTYLLFYP